MGICESAETIRLRDHSQKIDKELMMRTPSKVVQRLLLLGPGESGKSTLVKQMQIIHKQGFSKSEIEIRKSIIYSNTIRCMIDMVRAMPNLGIKLPQILEIDASILEKYVADRLEYEPFPPNIKKALINLWKDEAVQKCFKRKNEFQLNDSAQYFFDNLDRISAPNYQPTNQDILRSRVPTTGIISMEFDLGGINFNVFDVGGQRSQRRKWLHFFDNVHAIIFVAAISEYDQVLREDSEQNRLLEAIDLFENITTCIYFRQASMILFMNKKDLFEEKIKQKSLNILFSNYTGELNYDDGIEYLKGKFKRRSPKQKPLYIHVTCATDTDHVEKIFDTVFNMILTRNMTEVNL